MIRFLDLKNQICEDSNDFAFYDTVNDTIYSFGNNEQVFDSIEDFKDSYKKTQGTITRSLDDFLMVIPKDYFGKRDYIEYLIPIIDDMKDGKKELNLDDINFILKIIKAKIAYHEKIIDKDFYENIIYSIYN